METTYEIIELPSGYYRAKHGTDKDVRKFRALTVEDAKNLDTFNGQLYAIGTDRNAKQVWREVRQSGKVKTWKTRPLDVHVPFKYGFRDNGYLKFVDGKQTWDSWTILVQVD
jgi:hypothetical protein